MSTNKQALRERYSAEPTPKCHVCGTEMTVQRMSASRITYGCTGATYDDTGCHYTAGRSIADDHYEQSRVTVVDVSDPDVLELLDELEAVEKRIAELSASLKDLIGVVNTVNRSRHHEIKVDDDDEPCYWQRKEWIEYLMETVTSAESVYRAAGITVKGE